MKVNYRPILYKAVSSDGSITYKNNGEETIVIGWLGRDGKISLEPGESFHGPADAPHECRYRCKCGEEYDPTEHDYD